MGLLDDRKAQDCHILAAFWERFFQRGRGYGNGGTSGQSRGGGRGGAAAEFQQDKEEEGADPKQQPDHTGVKSNFKRSSQDNTLLVAAASSAEQRPMEGGENNAMVALPNPSGSLRCPLFMCHPGKETRG